eukprot:m.301207 g.301207  ORF g.301207 m.301207 type:complete len:77 (+) comp19563_c0_seq14:109-339(+)
MLACMTLQMNDGWPPFSPHEKACLRGSVTFALFLACWLVRAAKGTLSSNSSSIMGALHTIPRAVVAVVGVAGENVA